MAGPPAVRGVFWGLLIRQGRAEPSPAPTVELRNNAKIHKHSLTVYGRGGALLHPRDLAVLQGLSGRAMLAPTMKLQTSDIIFMKILPFACRGLHGRPANGAGADFWVCAAARAGEQCSPLRWNCKRAMLYLRKPESIPCRGLHCRPANGAGADFWVCAAANAGGAKPRPYEVIAK